MIKKNFRFEDFLKQKSFFLSTKKSMLIASVIVVVVSVIYFLLYLPAINLQNLAFDLFLIMMIFIFGLISCLLSGKFKILLNTLKVIALFGIILVIGLLSSFSVFRANAYQKQLKVEESTDFTSAFEAIDLNNIPLVDKAVAMTIGDKKIGEVQGLGSQYDIDDAYTIISIDDQIYRVSPLIYQSGVKWFQNRETGIPGYLKINVNDPNNAELINLDKGMKISPSSLFLENLFVFARLHYPTAMIGDYSFEIDDEGHPYYVLSTYRPEIGLFGGNDCTGVIIVDPINSTIERYNLDNIPTWVDHVQPINFALEQIDNWGYYIHGFFNTLFGQKDMLQTTDGYNYVNIDSQIHLYSGMTSVGSDHSIVGFGLINLKTKNAKFFRIGGADEESAMSSAQGQVQHLGYSATYPILLNVNDIPSYFVSLKDQEGLVKKYAFVSVANYSLVGVGDNVQEAQANYLDLLITHNIVTAKEDQTVYDSISGFIHQIASANISGDTVYYIQLQDSDILYVVNINKSSELPLSTIGDEISLTFAKSEEKVINAETFNNLNYDFE